MAQLGVVSLQAPAFGGINLQDSPVQMDYSFALVANNCVLDKYGRLSSRKGYEQIVANVAPIAIAEYVDSNGASDIIYVTATTIVSLQQGVLVTSDFSDVTLVLFNNQMFVYNQGTNNYKITGVKGSLSIATTTLPVKFTTAISSNGRIWGANGDVVYWSDLLIGDSFTTGSAGFINVSKVWANGEDEVVAIADHNNFLIIFGRNQVLIYQGYKEPETMTLADKVVGFGCVAKRSVQNIGSDVVFLSTTGVRSVMRLVQEKSAPLGNYSLNVKKELSQRSSLSDAKSFYSQKDNLYGLCFEDKIYAFDTTGLLPNGSAKVTTFTGGVVGVSYFVDRQSKLYIGKANGLGWYNGYTDNGSSYKMTFETGYLDFGNPSQLKFLKYLKATLLTEGSAQVYMKWAYDFSNIFRKDILDVEGFTTSYYGVGLYGVAVYGKGVVAQDRRTNTTGSGNIVQVGLEADINGGLLSVQRIDVFTTGGKQQ
jgi:hypothetical protein